MKIKFVYGIFPALVFYTDKIKEGFGGVTNGPIVRIRKKYENTDEGLLQHELTHVKQWYRTLMTHPIWYGLSQSYRLNAEIEAYKKQASYYRYDASGWMIDALCTKYGLTKFSREEITNWMKS